MPRRRISEEASSHVEEKPKSSFFVREGAVPVRIRSGAGVGFSHVDGKYLGKGDFEIDVVSEGPGSKSGWGHLANGDGWVALDYVEILN